MLAIVLVAASLWVCPGNVYSDEPREGCEPFHQSGQEGFSTIPEAPGFVGSGDAPEPTVKPRTSGQSTSPVIVEENVGRPYDSAETCSLYAEWRSLYTKSEDGLGAQNLSVDEFERWEKIRYLFNSLHPPRCP